MKLIAATGDEWKMKCVHYAQLGEDFLVTSFLESDRLFLRNLGFFYNYAMGETSSGFHFRLIGQLSLHNDQPVRVLNPPF